MSNVLDFNTAARWDQVGDPAGETTEERRERIKARPISSIIGQHIRLTRRGPELVGLCPFHNDTRPSLTVNDRKGVWKCFACDCGGDAIDFVEQYMNASFPAALDIIEGKEHKPAPIQRTPIERQPDPAKLLGENEQLGSPTGTWHYLDAESNIVATVRRYDLENGSKTYRPWDAKQSKPTMPDVRPLYNLPGILYAEPVILVEGEKAADALIRLGYNATTAMGGANAPLDKTDWQGIQGKSVIVWPDADAAGEKYRHAVVPHLRALGCTVDVVMPPAGVKKGWDAADADPEQAVGLISAAQSGANVEAGNAMPFPLVWADDVAASVDTFDFVEDVLTEEGMAVIYGESNCGKTFFATDLSLHVAWAAVDPSVTWRGKDIDGGAVIYLALEGGRGIQNRIAAAKQAFGLPKLPFAYVPCGVNLLDADADAPKLIELIQAVAASLPFPVRLIVVDTLARAMAGGNENASEDMGALVRNCDRIRQATGANVMFIHHSGKDAAKGARGHSSLRAATDTEIEVTRDEQAGVSTAKVTKQRDLEKGDEFSYRLKVVELGTNRRGKPVTSCVCEATDERAAPKAKPARQRIPDGPKVALRALVATMADKAIPAPNDRDFPSGARVVSVNSWRDTAYRHGISTGEADAKKKAFKRAVEWLLANQKVQIREPYAWLCGPDDEG